MENKQITTDYYTLDYPIKILKKWVDDIIAVFPINNFQDYKSVKDYNNSSSEILIKLMAINKAIKILEKENRIEILDNEIENNNQ